MEIISSLENIEKAFVLYFGNNNIIKIKRLFEELIIIGYSFDDNILKDNKINFISKNLQQTRYTDMDIKELIQSIRSYKEKNVAGFLLPRAPQTTIAIRTDCILQSQIGCLIHEIAHSLMVEEIVKLQNDNGEYVGTYVIFSTMPTNGEGEYTNEIIVEGITIQVLKIYNQLSSTEYKHTSGYIQADEIISSTGMRIFEQLQPAIKKHILSNAPAVREIMGNANYIKYSNLLQSLINHIRKSDCKKRNNYINQYKDYIAQKNKIGNEILFSVIRKVKEYEKYETDIANYVTKKVEEGQATRLE